MALIEIDDPRDARLDVFRRVPDADLRSWPGTPHGMFIGESDKVIGRALDAGVTCAALFMERKWVRKTQPIIDRLQAIDPAVPAYVVDHATFRAVTGYEVTRGALGALLRPVEPAVADVVRGAHRIAVLEDITNYTNIGAAFRSAAALGIDAVLVTPSCHDPLFRRAARVSMGTVFQVPWARIGTVQDWAAEGIPLLHELGFQTAALALSDDSVSIEDERLHAIDRLALVLGTEGDGLSAATIAQCDWTVKIPMSHQVDSLNVAAASAVAFWELRWRG